MHIAHCLLPIAHCYCLLLSPIGFGGVPCSMVVWWAGRSVGRSVLIPLRAHSFSFLIIDKVMNLARAETRTCLARPRPPPAGLVADHLAAPPLPRVPLLLLRNDALRKLCKERLAFTFRSLELVVERSTHVFRDDVYAVLVFLSAGV